MQKKKGVTEDELVRKNHWLNGHEFEQILEIVKDREDWHVAVHEVAKSQTWLSDWTATKLLLLTHKSQFSKSWKHWENMKTLLIAIIYVTVKTRIIQCPWIEYLKNKVIEYYEGIKRDYGRDLWDGGGIRCGSHSTPQIYQKYICVWNNSYRTPITHWQKTSDFKKAG